MSRFHLRDKDTNDGRRLDHKDVKFSKKLSPDLNWTSVAKAAKDCTDIDALPGDLILRGDTDQDVWINDLKLNFLVFKATLMQKLANIDQYNKSIKPSEGTETGFGFFCVIKRYIDAEKLTSIIEETIRETKTDKYSNNIGQPYFSFDKNLRDGPNSIGWYYSATFKLNF